MTAAAELSIPLAIDQARRPRRKDRARSPSKAFSTAGHCGQDDDRIALLDRGAKTVEDADVLVVEIDVDVAVEVAVLAEELFAGAGVLGGESPQYLADIGADGLDLGLAARLRAQHRGYADGRHQGGDPSLGGQGLAVAAGAGAESVVVGELAHLRLRDLGGVLAADRAVGVAAD